MRTTGVGNGELKATIGGRTYIHDGSQIICNRPTSSTTFDQLWSHYGKPLAPIGIVGYEPDGRLEAVIIADQLYVHSFDPRTGVTNWASAHGILFPKDPQLYIRTDSMVRGENLGNLIIITSNPEGAKEEVAYLPDGRRAYAEYSTGPKWEPLRTIMAFLGNHVPRV